MTVPHWCLDPAHCRPQRRLVAVGLLLRQILGCHSRSQAAHPRSHLMLCRCRLKHLHRTGFRPLDHRLSAAAHLLPVIQNHHLTQHRFLIQRYFGLRYSMSLGCRHCPRWYHCFRRQSLPNSIHLLVSPHSGPLLPGQDLPRWVAGIGPDRRYLDRSRRHPVPPGVHLAGLPARTVLDCLGYGLDLDSLLGDHDLPAIRCAADSDPPPRSLERLDQCE